MNSISTISQKFSPRRTISRYSNFLTTLSRGIIYSRCCKLYYYSNKYTMKWNTTRTSTIIRMSSSFNCNSSITISTSTSRCYYNTTNRSKSKYIILRSCRGWRPSSISTLILIFRTPRSIYFNSTRIRGYFTYCSS